MENKKVNVGFGVILSVCLLAIISISAVYQAQQFGQYDDTNFALKQGIFYFVGAIAAVVMLLFDFDQLRKLAPYLYGAGIVLLIGIIIAPPSLVPLTNGARSWFKIPFLGTFQPSELMKVFLILFLATMIMKHREQIDNPTIRDDWKLLGKMTLATMLPISLVMMQTDLGTSLVMIAILAGMVFVSGISWRIILPIIASGISFIAGIFYLILYHPEILSKYFKIKEYQLGRIYAWLTPEQYTKAEAFHLQKSLLAIGSGELYGAPVKNAVYLPEAQTDFIFAIIAGNWGFIGGSIVISVFFLLVYNMIKIGLDIHASNPFGTYICAGVVSYITFHVLENIGMTIGLLPITGIPLPLVSYGGSSMLGAMMAIGLILNVQRNIKKYMFS